MNLGPTECALFCSSDFQLNETDFCSIFFTAIINSSFYQLSQFREQNQNKMDKNGDTMLLIDIISIVSFVYKITRKRSNHKKYLTIKFWQKYHIETLVISLFIWHTTGQFRQLVLTQSVIFALDILEIWKLNSEHWVVYDLPFSIQASNSQLPNRVSVT